MKKLLMAAIGLMMVVGANAQYLNDSDKVFEQDKWYVGASLSGLDLGWHKGSEWSADIQAKAGYLFIDDWMITGTLGYDWYKKGDDTFTIGAGLRYYIEQNGLYLGANLNYVHAYKGCNDLMPGVEVGYAFFLSRTVTVEPAIYYNISTKDFSDRSTVGLKIGFGIYLND